MRQHILIGMSSIMRRRRAMRCVCCISLTFSSETRIMYCGESGGGAARIRPVYYAASRVPTHCAYRGRRTCHHALYNTPCTTPRSLDMTAARLLERHLQHLPAVVGVGAEQHSLLLLIPVQQARVLRVAAHLGGRVEQRRPHALPQRACLFTRCELFRPVVAAMPPGPSEHRRGDGVLPPFYQVEEV